MKMRKPRSGFTLIELLVVMGVILILAGIVVGVQRGVYYQQSQARAKADLQAIANALESFKLKYGDYPWLGADAADSSEGNATELFQVLTGQLVLRKSGSQYDMLAPSTNQRVPLIDENLIDAHETSGNPDYFIDPWGNPYKYYYKTVAQGRSGTGWNHSGFILMSTGPDRRTGPTSGTGYNLGTGIFPQNGDDYFGTPGTTNYSFDNIIFGLEAP